MEAITPYRFVLIDTNGAQLGEALSPLLPRYLHAIDAADGQEWELTDNPDPEPTPFHVTTFARIGSAVYVDDDRDAMFVRVAP